MSEKNVVELPVTVDSLKATMDDPTINHYKVIGLAGDWATTAELGDFNVEFVVPSKTKDLLKIMFGEDAITELTKVTLKGTGDATLDASTGFTGIAVEPKKFKIKGTIVIVDDEKENLMVITNIAHHIPRLLIIMKQFCIGVLFCSERAVSAMCQRRKS